MKHTKGYFVFTIALLVISGIGIENGNAQKKKYDVLLGTWDAVVQTDGGDYYNTFIFTLENDSLTGVFSSELGDSPLENLKFEDNKVSCDFTIEMADGELYLEVEFDIEENEMTGNVFADMDDFPITATKRKEEEKKN